MSLAWHMAALPKAKKFPKLKDLLATPPSKRRRQQDADEQLAMMRDWMAARRSRR